MRKMSDQLLEQIKVFILEYSDNNGFPPTVRDICDGLNIKSTATAFKYVQKLSDLGVLNKAPLKTRALSVVGSKKDKMTEIPLVGKIAAGSPITAIENIEEVYTFPQKMFSASDDVFMLTIQGDSMIEAGICNGDKVVLERTSTAINGEIVACLIDDSATIKRFYKEQDYFRLHPENSSMSDIITKECEILGKIIGLIRNY